MVRIYHIVHITYKTRGNRLSIIGKAPGQHYAISGAVFLGSQQLRPDYGHVAGSVPDSLWLTGQRYVFGSLTALFHRKASTVRN